MGKGVEWRAQQLNGLQHAISLNGVESILKVQFIHGLTHIHVVEEPLSIVNSSF